MSDCAHEFQPIQGWQGRYRCKYCWAIAYRKFVMGKDISNSTKLVLYKCSVNNCTEPAVSYKGSRRGKQLCKKHNGEENGT